MNEITGAGNPGRKPLGLVGWRVTFTPAQDALLNRVSHATGLSKSALVRTAVDAWAVSIGQFAPGSIDRTIPTRLTRKEHR